MLWLIVNNITQTKIKNQNRYYLPIKDTYRKINHHQVFYPKQLYHIMRLPIPPNTPYLDGLIHPLNLSSSPKIQILQINFSHRRLLPHTAIHGTVRIIYPFRPRTLPYQWISQRTSNYPIIYELLPWINLILLKETYISN